jgi:5-methylcytosine-specific restriction endonuclease McrA
MRKVCSTCGRIYEPYGGKPHAHCPSCQTVHDRRHNARSNAKSKAQGRTTQQWRRVRLMVLERDGYTCQRCGAQPHSSQLHAHLDPRLNGNHWNATLADCTTLCRSCHGTVDAPRASRRS